MSDLSLGYRVYVVGRGKANFGELRYHEVRILGILGSSYGCERSPVLGGHGLGFTPAVCHAPFRDVPAATAKMCRYCRL